MTNKFDYDKIVCVLNLMEQDCKTKYFIDKRFQAYIVGVASFFSWSTNTRIKSLLTKLTTIFLLLIAHPVKARNLK